MSITDEAYTRGHVQGWADAAQALASRMLQVLAEPEPDPRAAQVLCLNCDQTMELGQPASTVGRDVANRTLWVHQNCPPKTWFGQPQLAAVPQQDEDQGEEDQGEQLLQEEDEPEILPTIMQASATGQPLGPWVITVTHVNGAFVARVDLDWEEFRPASAGHRLTEKGLRVLPSAMMHPGTHAGWTRIGEFNYSAPVCWWERNDPTPLAETATAPAGTVDSDSGSGYSLAKLPKRVPGEALAAEQQHQIVLETTFHSQDETAHSVTYAVSNTECQVCQGFQHLIMTYDETGQWLRSRSLVCLTPVCGAVVKL